MISLRQKIAQMLIIGFSGLTLDDNSLVSQWLMSDGLGVVLLFDIDWATRKPEKNLRDKEQIKRLNQDLNDYSALGNNKQPLFIAIDYEGGAVDRLRNIADCMPTMKPCDQALLSNDEWFTEASNMAVTLKELGFNLNFAPVVDLNLNQEQGIIGKLGRSFSDDPIVVSNAAAIFVQAFAKQKMACSYKHFPGHGSAIGDTHEGFVDVTDTYQASELQPYRSLAEHPEWPLMVMTAHVINRQLDPSGLPATLSHPMLTGLLREEMGFDGVIVRDDLQMQAISHHYSMSDALKLTINAGADMVIFGNQLGSITAKEVIDCIEQLVKKGDIKLDRIESAYQRIVCLKRAIA